MKKISPLFFLLLASLGAAQAQKGDTLFLVAPGNSNFLLPFIENTIIGLKDWNTGKPIFQSVQQPINRLTEGMKLEKTSRQTLDVADDSAGLDVRSSPSGARLHRDVTKLILNNRDLLRVDITPLAGNIEYQFTLVKAPKQKGGSENTKAMPGYDWTKPYFYKSIFINPSDKDHEKQLANIIKSIWVNADRPPVPVLKVNGLEGDSVFYTTPGTAVMLDASSSVDYDTPKSELSFKWKKYGEGGFYDISDSVRHALSMDDTGSYRFSLQISDGIKPAEREFSIHVESKPTLILAEKNLEVVKRDYAYNDVGSSIIYRDWVTSSLLNGNGKYLKLTIQEEKKKKIWGLTDTVRAIERMLNHASPGDDRLRLDDESDTLSRLNINYDTVAQAFNIGIWGVLEPGNYTYLIHAYTQNGVESNAERIKISYILYPYNYLGLINEYLDGEAGSLVMTGIGLRVYSQQFLSFGISYCKPYGGSFVSDYFNSDYFVTGAIHVYPLWPLHLFLHDPDAWRRNHGNVFAQFLSLNLKGIAPAQEPTLHTPIFWGLGFGFEVFRWKSLLVHLERTYYGYDFYNSPQIGTSASYSLSTLFGY